MLRVIRVEREESQGVAGGVLPIEGLQPLGSLHELTVGVKRGRTVLCTRLRPDQEVVRLTRHGDLDQPCGLLAQGAVPELDLGEQNVLECGAEGDQGIGDEQRDLSRPGTMRVTTLLVFGKLNCSSSSNMPPGRGW